MDTRAERMAMGYFKILCAASARTLLNYLYGDRSISKKDAGSIYSRIQTEKLEKYMEKRSFAAAK